VLFVSQIMVAFSDRPVTEDGMRGMNDMYGVNISGRSPVSGLDEAWSGDDGSDPRSGDGIGTSSVPSR
jgi:hypothetical protein